MTASVPQSAGVAGHVSSRQSLEPPAVSTANLPPGGPNRPAVFSRERRNRLIVLLWRRGVSCDAIGAMVGCSDRHAARIALAFGEAPRGNPTAPSFWMSRHKCNEFAIITKMLSRSGDAARFVAEGRTRDQVCRAMHIRRADLELLALYAGFDVPAGDCEGVDGPEQVKLRSCVACSIRFEAKRFRFRCDSCVKADGTVTEYMEALPL